MNRILCPLAVVVCAAVIVALPGCSRQFTSTNGYQFDFKGETAVRQQDGQIPADIETVEVNNQFGGVRVEGTDQEDLSWTWELTCWASDADMAELLSDGTELNVSQQDGTQSWIVVLPEPPVPELRGVRSDLVLKVPASVKVLVSNSFGKSSINNVQGSAVVENRHGPVELVGVSGSVDVKNEHGAVHATGIGSAHLKNQHGEVKVLDAAGDLIVHNQHGKVTVEGVQGALEVNNEHGRVEVTGVVGRAEIGTTHSSIRVEDAQGDVLLRDRHGSITALRVAGRLEIENQHGSIEADVDSIDVVCKSQHGPISLSLRNPELRSVRAETSFAGLTLRLPQLLAPVIEADAPHGKVKSDFPVLMANTGANGVEQADGIEARVVLRNSHGDIRIEKGAGIP